MKTEKIIATNTAIIIKDYHMGDSEKLEQTFSVWDPICHKLVPFGMYYDEMNERLYLPRDYRYIDELGSEVINYYKGKILN